MEVWLPFDLRRAIIIKFILIIYHALIGLLQEETTPLGLGDTHKIRPRKIAQLLLLIFVREKIFTE